MASHFDSARVPRSSLSASSLLYDWRMALPRKRTAVEVRIVEHEGEPVAVMTDREGLFDGMLALRYHGALIWDLLDGNRDVADIQAFIAEKTGGDTADEAAVRGIVAKLDDMYLLDTPRAQERRREVAALFALAKTRPARFVGSSGPAEAAAELERELDGYFTGEYGAGLPDGSRDAGLRGILAPHIDFARGGSCYSHAYRCVAEAAPADVYLVLAVAHQSPEPPFIPTTKSYETPLGTAEVDTEFVEALLKRTKRAGLDAEMAHRTEHSAEFQAVFLRHARRRGPAFTVVPILCSVFERYCGAKSPSTAAIVEDYIGALEETVRGCGRRVCIVAGVDFAHVGPHFGDPEPAEKLIDRMMEGDKRSLAHVSSCDAEGFWASVMEDQNWRKVCGLSATYASLRLLKGSQAKLLRYTYAPDPADGIVSFAAASFR